MQPLMANFPYNKPKIPILSQTFGNVPLILMSHIYVLQVEKKEICMFHTACKSVMRFLPFIGS